MDSDGAAQRVCNNCCYFLVRGYLRVSFDARHTVHVFLFVLLLFSLLLMGCCCGQWRLLLLLWLPVDMGLLLIVHVFKLNVPSMRGLWLGRPSTRGLLLLLDLWWWRIIILRS